MLKPEQLHGYQWHSVDHILEHPSCGLLLDMGLGKTAATLTAFDILINQTLEVNKTLIIAPKRVAEKVWHSEALKWEHLKHLKFSRVLGTERQRKEALKVKADFYVINRENVAWLVAQYGTAFPFDAMVIDELSSFKNSKSARFKALKTVQPLVSRVVALTGTPVPNGLLDLWPQMYLLDRGERLGKTLTSYRDKYFQPGKRNGHIIYEYNLKKDANADLLGSDWHEKEIYEKISDICISMKSEDYLELPGTVERIVEVNLSPEIMDKYHEFEKKLVLELDDAEEISAMNAAGLSNKLLQFTNGAVYDSEKNWYEVHREKLEELEEVLEFANGRPVIVFYSFIHDWERIRKYFARYKPVQLQSDKQIDDWNAGKIQLLVAHPASCGHGLNLQEGGNIAVWFGPTWNLEQYQQANKRLDRQGQTEVVTLFRFIAKGTIEERVVTSVNLKASGQDAMMNAVKAIVRDVRERIRTAA
jgi:SNF2 family DNA or RNA helicase